MEPGLEIRMVWENLALAMALWSGTKKGLITKDHLPSGRTVVPTDDGRLVHVYNPLVLKNEQDLARCVNNQVRGAVTFSAMQTHSTLDSLYKYPPLGRPGVTETDPDLRAARCAIYLIYTALSQGLLAPVWNCPAAYRQYFEVRPVSFVLDAASLDGKPVYWEDFGGLGKYLDLLEFCMLVTERRADHPHLGLAGTGPEANQAEAGQAYPGRSPVTISGNERVASFQVTAFLEAKCVMEPESYTIARELYDEYLAWCQDTGQTPLVQRSFGIQLSRLGFIRKRRGRGKHWWKGLERQGGAGQGGAG